MALRVMLTAAKVVIALSHQSHRVLLRTVIVKIRMAQRQDTAADESSDSDTTESNSLMEQITDKVNEDFVGVGMPSLLSGEIRTFFY